jgi:hypothetical protein
MLAGDADVLDAVTTTGDERLPSVFDVTGFAVATVAAATLGAAELLAERNSSAIDEVHVTAREACAAFQCEWLFTPEGWERPAVWDPIAGDYEAADGWIKLHTNYGSHRAAALAALGVAGDRDAVADAVARWPKDDLEARIVEHGGAAAAMHRRDEWATHPHGHEAASQAPIAIDLGAPVDRARRLAPSARPLEGVKVLDLTRVIAGPVGTRFLAAWGADVLRIDPPGFEEVQALVPESSAGKRCAALDLATEQARFHELVAEADVVVHGLRPGALAKLGLDNAQLRARHPHVIVSEHDAYGWSGPWARRRGFDSLVQMSCGIAATQGTDRPRPLPCQALDHGTGFLIAAAVCRALTHRQRTGGASTIRGALIGAANVLFDSPTPDGMDVPVVAWDEQLEPRATEWGPARAVPIPGRIGGSRPALSGESGPLGRHPAEFATS